MSLISNIPRFIKGLNVKSTFDKVISPSSTVSAISIASRLRAYVTTLKAKYDNFSLAFAQNPDFLPPGIVDGLELSLDNVDKFISDLDGEEYENIIDALEILGLPEEPSETCLHLTDSNGNDVSLARVDDVINGVEGIVATTLYPTDTTDFFIYKDENGYHMNALVTAFNQLDGSMLDIDTIEEAVIALMSYIGSQTSFTTVLDGLRAICNSLSIVYYDSNTILDLVNLIRQHYGEETSDVVSSIIDTARSKHVDPVNLSFFDIVHDIINTQEINSLTIDICSQIMLGSNSLADLLPGIIDATNHGIASTVQFATGAKRAASVGGPYGLICYLAQGWNQANSLAIEDGVMTFADNSSFMPVNFVAGALAAVGEFALQVISAAALVISPVLGGVASLISSAFGAIFKGVDYSESLEYAALKDDIGCSDYGAPYGILQFEKTYDIAQGQIIPADLYDAIEQAAGPLEIEVPGGYMLIGKGGVTKNDEGRITAYSIRFEFHPEFSGLSVKVLRSCINSDYAYATDNGDAYVSREFALTASPTQRDALSRVGHDINRAYFDDTFFDALDPVTVPVNGDNGRLSLADDFSIRDRVISSMATFIIWATSYGFLNNGFPEEYQVHFQTGTPGINPPFYFLNSSFLNFSFVIGYAIFRYGAIYGFTIDGTKGKVHAYTNTPVSQSLPVWQGSIAWEHLAQLAANLQVSNATYYSPLPVWTNRLFLSSVTTLSSRYQSSLITPKYNAGSVWRFIAIAAIATAVVTVVTVAVSVKAAKAIKKKRAKLTADVYNKYEKFRANPGDDDLYKDYRKSVRKNNAWTSIFGGSKYNSTSYWDGDCSSSTQDVPLASGDFNSIIAGQDTSNLATSGVTLEGIRQLISGVRINQSDISLE